MKQIETQDHEIEAIRTAVLNLMDKIEEAYMKKKIDHKTYTATGNIVAFDIFGKIVENYKKKVEV